MIRKAISIGTVLALICLSSLNIKASDISVSAQSAYLVSYDTKETLFAKNATERLPMASITKIMTCLVAIESGTPDSIVTVDNRSVGVEGSSMYLECGDALTLEELLYAMMLRSANDAATAVAYHISGDIVAFADLMNTKAAKLGLCNTHFDNPHGLPSESHYTSAEDFARLTVYALDNPTFHQIVSSKSHTVRFQSGKEVCIVNHNRLLNSYEGANGVKTGYTKASGRCLVSSATRNGVTLVAVTLNAHDDWNDHKTMLDYGFSKLYRTTAVQKGQIRHKIGVAGNGYTDIVNRDEINLVLSTDSKISYKVFSNHMLFAPLDINTPVGYAEVYVDSKPVSAIPLYPVADVAEEKTEKSKILSFFKFWE